MPNIRTHETFLHSYSYLHPHLSFTQSYLFRKNFISLLEHKQKQFLFAEKYQVWSNVINKFVIESILKMKPYVKSIQKSKNHQRRSFLDNYYRQRCLV
jgi:hypothetical protein